MLEAKDRTSPPGADSCFLCARPRLVCSLYLLGPVFRGSEECEKRSARPECLWSCCLLFAVSSRTKLPISKARFCGRAEFR